MKSSILLSSLLYVMLASLCLAQTPVKPVTLKLENGKAVISNGKSVDLPPLLKRTDKAPNAAALAASFKSDNSAKASVKTTTLVSRYPAEYGDSSAGVDKTWVKSESNPMRTGIVFPDGTFKWSTKSQAEKAQFVELYRRCGHHIVVEEYQAAENSKETVTVIKARRVKFEAPTS